jgi:hypothetical protein
MEGTAISLGDIIKQNAGMIAATLLGCAGNASTWNSFRFDQALINIGLRRQASNIMVISALNTDWEGRKLLLKETMLYGVKTVGEAGLTLGLGALAVANIEPIQRVGLSAVAGFIAGETIRDAGNTARYIWGLLTIKA